MWKAIEHDIATAVLDAAVSTAGPGAVDFVVQPHQEREVSGLDRKGAPRYKTKHWLDVTNTGSRDAQDVTYETDEDSGMVILGRRGGPTTVHRGQTRRLPVTFVMAGSGDPVLRIRWTEDGQDRRGDFHVG